MPGAFGAHQMPEASPIARQLLRDERKLHHRRIIELTAETAKCFKAGFYDAALTMQFVELDTWAYLMRPKEMTKHGRTSYRHFVRKYLRVRDKLTASILGFPW